MITYIVLGRVRSMVFGFDKPDIDKLEKKNDVKGIIKALEYKKGLEYKKDILGPYKVREKAADALRKYR